MQFDAAFDALIGNEGGYSYNSQDPGGETMWGVTARVARGNGYTGDMKLLPRETAKAIYRRLYWDAVQAEELPELLRFQVFDAAVNSGPAQAVRWLQAALGIRADGIIGPVTHLALASANAVRVGIVFDAERLESNADLPTWAAFGRGWAKRAARNLRTLAGELA
jgi:lysozyme family protein